MIKIQLQNTNKNSAHYGSFFWTPADNIQAIQQRLKKTWGADNSFIISDYESPVILDRRDDLETVVAIQQERARYGYQVFDLVAILYEGDLEQTLCALEGHPDWLAIKSA
jgi:hypothetical protein